VSHDQLEVQPRVVAKARPRVSSRKLRTLFSESVRDSTFVDRSLGRHAEPVADSRGEKRGHARAAGVSTVCCRDHAATKRQRLLVDEAAVEVGPRGADDGLGHMADSAARSARAGRDHRHVTGPRGVRWAPALDADTSRWARAPEC
jgi:hypothetical protein